MSEIVQRMRDFQSYAAMLAGDEKGEAQVFVDRLFQAFGHKGYKEAGATLEHRIKKKDQKGTSFADLIWKPRILIEMKKRGAKLQLHYNQAFDYWLNAVPNRPRYVALCNFDDFWIYDFDRQLDEPVDRVSVAELDLRYPALNFLFPVERKPVFENDREAVSQRAAKQTAELFRELTRRPANRLSREDAQRFVLQLVIAMFAEDIDLLPASTISGLVHDCVENGQSSFDLFGGLVRQMDNPVPAKNGRYAHVPYFNGGLFSRVVDVELQPHELELIGGPEGAARENWSKVNPAIFGTLFQRSMDAKEQHQHGRHFTSEADIQRIVAPSIVRPWQKRIDAAKSKRELLGLRKELREYKVLDPACGSGNFLYVAFRELSRLDLRLMSRLKELVSTKEFEKQSKLLCAVSPSQFFGIDNDPFGVELAKVTLMLAKKLALDEAIQELFDEDHEFGKGTGELDLHGESALPLDNLDENFLMGDALFEPWPKADVIVGNPPYQSKNKLQEELGPAYLMRLRERHPDIDGRADYCVYWFRLAHDHLAHGQRAGLVGTNTIRQNYSRMGGLDYIVSNGGTITEAVSSMIWPGEASLSVSIVNWVKGDQPGSKRLYVQEGHNLSDGWRFEDFDKIGSSLSFMTDVTKAKPLKANVVGGCHQGQTHGHASFLIASGEARRLIKEDPSLQPVLKPFMTSNDLVSKRGSKPSRYVIDFSDLDVLQSEKFKKLFQRVKTNVLPDRQKAADREAKRNADLLAENPKAKGNLHHANFLKNWWKMSYSRDDMMSEVKKLSRYIVCGQVTKRPIFDFVCPSINPNAALTVFTHEDDYTFGILQSTIHWIWFTNRCSTLTERPRYTSNTVFDSFPWPQTPTRAQVSAVAKAAVDLREMRQLLCAEHDRSLRELYRSMENPGEHPLKAATAKLDDAVRRAYGFKKGDDVLTFLLSLNLRLSEDEKEGKAITGPGIPDIAKGLGGLVTKDCIKP